MGIVYALSEFSFGKYCSFNLEFWYDNSLHICKKFRATPISCVGEASVRIDHVQKLLFYVTLLAAHCLEQEVCSSF